MANAPDDAELDALCHQARLRLDAGARAELTRRLSAVLGSFAALRAVDTRSVAPEEPATAPLRADEPGPVLALDAVLCNAQRTAGDCFLVPRVVEG